MGIHPAYNGHASLPYLDHINVEEIELLLVTQYVPNQFQFRKISSAIRFICFSHSFVWNVFWFTCQRTVFDLWVGWTLLVWLFDCLIDWLIDWLMHFTAGVFLFFSFHLDHIGALPYFLMKTKFKGRCFMTHATKAIYLWMLKDFLRVSQGQEQLFTEQDLEASMDKIETVDFHEVCGFASCFFSYRFLRLLRIMETLVFCSIFHNIWRFLFCRRKKLAESGFGATRRDMF